MKRESAALALVAVAAGAVLLLHAAHYGNTWIDDAYITFRYGRNLMAGEGLVFNPGTRVEGITNLAWGVLTAPFTAGDPLFAARILGMAFALGTVGLIAAWARAERLHPVGAAIAMAPWVLLPWAPFWAIQGLETPAVAFLVTLGWSRYSAEISDRRWPLAALGLGLAPSFRPDAAIYAPLVLLWHLRVRGRRSFDGHAVRSALVVIACAAALVAFKLAYFGALLPNTFYAKTKPWPWWNGIQYAASFFQAPDGRFAWATLVAVLFGLTGAIHARSRTLPALVFVSGFTGAIASNGDFFANYRMLVPILPAGGACLALLFQDVITRSHRPWGWIPAIAVTAALVAPQLDTAQADRLRDDTHIPVTSATITRKKAPFGAPWKSMDWMRGMTEQWVFPAAWTLVHTLPAERVAFTDIGLLSFLNANPIVDLLGLTDPRMVPPRGVAPDAHWKTLRRDLPTWTDFLILERGSDRWQRILPERSRHWRMVDGCGNVGVYASEHFTRSLDGGPTEGWQARVDTMFVHFPRFPTLHVAVFRELAAAGVGPEELEPLVTRAASLATSSMQPVFNDLKCPLGIGPGCTARVDLCNGGAPQERPALTTDPAQPPRSGPGSATMPP